MSKCLSIFGVCLLACLASGTAQTLPNATSPEAGIVKEGGEDQWKTTLLIQSEKPYWFIKSAEIADPVNRRVCSEDTTADKSASRLVLSNVTVEYPMPRRQNGDFNVIVTPQAGYDKTGMTRCTYNANLKFFHGTKSYSVKNTFVFNFSPGKDHTKEEPSFVKPKTVAGATQPKTTQPVEKMEPVKTAQEKAKAAQTKTVEKAEKTAAQTKEKIKAKTKMEPPKKMDVAKKVPDVKMPAAKEKDKPAKPEPEKAAATEKPAEKQPVKTAEVKPVTPTKVEPPKTIVPETPKTETPKEEPAKTEAPKTEEASKTAEPTATNKVFEPEDLPEPEKVEVSEEAKLALAQPVKEAEKKSAAAQQDGSPLKEGMMAYEAGKLQAAVQSLSSVPVPQTKQRGAPERDAYVEANFYKGMAAQKLGSLKQAITAYQEVLKYEKYHPVVSMNLGICYLELRQFAKANRAFRNVERDQNRIPPEQYDDVMQRTRYFWAVTWTRMYRSSSQPDRKAYYHRQALAKWNEYKTWYGEMEKYSKANSKADDYIATMQ